MKLLIELDEEYIKAIDKIKFLVGGRTDRKLQLEIIKAIKNGKVLEQEPRWIPVSERLPKENGRYLVTVQNLTGYERLDNNVFECEFFYTDWVFKGWEDNKVVAWMPLPKAYREVEE